MAEEPLVVRGISRRHTFPFINIFRAFRVAVHPSKLVLALVALLLLYAGGHVLDLCWPVADRAVLKRLPCTNSLLHMHIRVKNLPTFVRSTVIRLNRPTRRNC